MQRVAIPFSLEVSGSEAPNVKSGLLQNMYAVIDEKSSVLRQRYGMEKIATFENNIAGLLLRGGKIYCLADNKINVFTADGTPITSYVYLHSSNDRFIFLYNNVEAAGLSNTGAYFVLSDAGVVSQPAFPEGWASSYFTYLDGYFVFSNNGMGLNQQFFFSGILNATSFNGLDFGSAIEKNDSVTAVFGSQNGLWVFGQNSIEIFQNSGDNDDPFQQIPGASTTSIGCVSPYSIAEALNSIFFVGYDNNVYMSEGYSSKPIGTPYVVEVISRYEDKGSIYGFIWRERGLNFYVVTLPGKRTFAYCINTGKWCEFKTFGCSEFKVSFCDAFGSDLFCTVGKDLFKVTAASLSDGDLPMEREFSTEEFETEGLKSFITHYVDLVVTSGSKKIEQTSGAELDFSYSEDSGITWKGERFIDLGVTGDYGKITIARRLGSAKRRIYRMGCAEPLELSVRNIYAGIDIADGD